LCTSARNNHGFERNFFTKDKQGAETVGTGEVALVHDVTETQCSTEVVIDKCVSNTTFIVNLFINLFVLSEVRKMSVHTNTQINEDTDLVENMLKETGCIDLHHKVQARSLNLFEQ
jgi:hypothetical protein